MASNFNATAATHGGLGTALSTAFVLLGVMLLLDLMESKIAWGLYSILCGGAFALGMVKLGRCPGDKESGD